MIECYVADIYVRTPGNLNIANQQWHHIAVTWTGTTYKIYIDGTINTTSTSSGTTPNIDYTHLGVNSRTNNDDPGFFSIDCLRVFPRILSNSEISAYYTNGN